jgi:hypothetical protein
MNAGRDARIKFALRYQKFYANLLILAIFFVILPRFS